MEEQKNSMEKYMLKLVWGIYLEAVLGICLEVNVGAVPKKSKKAKKARNAKKAAGKVSSIGGFRQACSEWER